MSPPMPSTHLEHAIPEASGDYNEAFTLIVSTVHASMQLPGGFQRGWRVPELQRIWLETASILKGSSGAAPTQKSKTSFEGSDNFFGLLVDTDILPLGAG